MTHNKTSVHSTNQEIGHCFNNDNALSLWLWHRGAGLILSDALLCGPSNLHTVMPGLGWNVHFLLQDPYC